MEPYIVNVSSVQDFMSCRFRWWAKWIMNRVPREESPALGGGKLLHLIFEDHALGMPMKDAADKRLAEWKAALAEPGIASREIFAGEKAIKIVDDLAEALPLWQDKYEFSTPVLEAEEPFEIEFDWLPGVLWRGRPDRYGIANGNLWHVQNRGLAASTNFGLYIELAKRHYHEHLYAEAAARKYPDISVGGTFFNLVRKLKYRTNVGKKNEAVKTPEEMFFQHPMTISLKGNGPSARLHKHVMYCLEQHVRLMMRAETDWQLEQIIPPPNEKMNGGAFGNIIDPYFKVLIGEIKLSDDSYFKDREDTYATADVLTAD